MREPQLLKGVLDCPFIGPINMRNQLLGILEPPDLEAGREAAKDSPPW